LLVGDTASAIASAASSGGTQSRIGKVASVNGSSVTVMVAGGTLIDVPYTLGSQVIPGDTVPLIQAGNQWYALPPFAGVPSDNLIANGSFEDSSGNPDTSGWDFLVIQNTAGTPSWSVNDAGTFAVGDYVAGTKAAWIDCSTTGVGSDCEGRLRSAAIPVTPGETYAGVASVAANMPPPIDYKISGSFAVLPLVQVDVGIEYYNSAVATSPIGAADYGSVPPVAFQYRLMRCPLAVIPGGVTHIRLVVDFSAHDTDTNTYVLVVDRCILRKIRNIDGTLAF
jgi:hypothetical protein